MGSGFEGPAAGAASVADRSTDEMFGGTWSPGPDGAPRYHCLVAGRWRPPESGRYFDVVNPATGRAIASVGEASELEVDQALAFAEAFSEHKAVQPIERLVENVLSLFARHDLIGRKLA